MLVVSILKKTLYIALDFLNCHDNKQLIFAVNITKLYLLSQTFSWCQKPFPRDEQRGMVII